MWICLVCAFKHSFITSPLFLRCAFLCFHLSLLINLLQKLNDTHSRATLKLYVINEDSFGNYFLDVRTVKGASFREGIFLAEGEKIIEILLISSRLQVLLGIAKLKDLLCWRICFKK